MNVSTGSEEWTSSVLVSGARGRGYVSAEECVRRAVKSIPWPQIFMQAKLAYLAIPNRSVDLRGS